jgi:uncharacterized protein with FMN-binding domain
MRGAIPAILLTAAGFYFVWQYQPGAASDIVAAPAPTVIPSAPSTGSTSSTTKTVAGSVEPSEYGNVQVQVTFDGNRITDVQFLRLPSSGPSQAAGPILLQETLQAQNAQVDAVSGATQTSESYVKSLQSAIDAKGA